MKKLIVLCLIMGLLCVLCACQPPIASTSTSSTQTDTPPSSTSSSSTFLQDLTTSSQTPSSSSSTSSVIPPEPTFDFADAMASLSQANPTWTKTEAHAYYATLDVTLMSETTLKIMTQDGQNHFELTYSYEKLNSIGSGATEPISTLEGVLYASGEDIPACDAPALHGLTYDVDWFISPTIDQNDDGIWLVTADVEPEKIDAFLGYDSPFTTLSASFMIDRETLLPLSTTLTGSTGYGLLSITALYGYDAQSFTMPQ